MTDRNESDGADARHGEYKIPGGKLVVVDLRVVDGRLCGVRLSGDFFLEPPETIDSIDAALNGLPADAEPAALERAVRAGLGDGAAMYGLTVAGIVVVVQRALA